MIKPGAEFKATRLRSEFREWSKSMGFPIVSELTVHRPASEEAGGWVHYHRAEQGVLVFGARTARARVLS